MSDAVRVKHIYSLINYAEALSQNQIMGNNQLY